MRIVLHHGTTTMQLLERVRANNPLQRFCASAIVKTMTVGKVFDAGAAGAGGAAGAAGAAAAGGGGGKGKGKGKGKGGKGVGWTFFPRPRTDRPLWKGLFVDEDA